MTERDFRITIIITSYNHRAYLIDAIESVLAQTLMPHEIIVADDMSSDGSRETIREYEQKYPGLVKGVFQERNCGIPKNRNTALRIATGNYVGILDGDDWFLPEKLEKQVAALRLHPEAKVVYGNFRIVDSQRRPLGMKWRGSQPTGRVFCDIAKGKTGLLRTLIADYQAIKEAGFMDERFPCYDGLWLTIKLAAACDIAYVDEILLDKREHPASVSKGLRMEAGMQELTGIHQNLLPLLPMYASEQEQALIKSSWARVLRSFAAHTH
jgi:glycosyltransferase involved in cell wall biosynthesis